MSADYLEGNDHILGLTAIVALWKAECECEGLRRINAVLVESVRQLLMHSVNPYTWTAAGVEAKSPGLLSKGDDTFTEAERILIANAGRTLVRVGSEVKGLDVRRLEQFREIGEQIKGWVAADEPKPEPTTRSPKPVQPVTKARGAALLRRGQR